MKGKFITFEGSEGSGKSTQIKILKDFLQKQGIDVVLTREPGGTEVSEKIRNLLLDKQNKLLCTDAELLLVFASRSQHLHELIIPSLEQGKWVICDRFTDATFAYQGTARGLGFDKILPIKNWVQGELSPDLTLLFDLDVSIGLDRASKRGEADRFESEKVDFFNKVRKGYIRIAENEPQRVKLIDASESIDKVTQEMLSHIRKIM